jgi:hypothetical protein
MSTSQRNIISQSSFFCSSASYFHSCPEANYSCLKVTFFPNCIIMMIIYNWASSQTYTFLWKYSRSIERIDITERQKMSQLHMSWINFVVVRNIKEQSEREREEEEESQMYLCFSFVNKGEVFISILFRFE